jgi:TonB family protein
MSICLCYNVRMRIATLLFLVCLAEAFPTLAQKDDHVLPTVTDFECPKYPSDAKSMRLQGTVKMQVTTDGHLVADVKVLSGHPALARAATKNVQTWKFAESSATAFTVTYVYASEGNYKRDPVTKCDAKMELPTHVTVSTQFPFPN